MGKNISVQKLGGTTDISAGQLIDRTGVLLGLPFPCGKELDRISSESESRDCFHPKVYGCDFSLSGGAE
jgi:N6-L-threonylcarbamoyladenine synthase